MSTPGEQVQQAASVRQPRRFPLVSRLGFRSTTFALSDPTVLSPVSDAALINCYAELDPEDGQYWVEKRLGLQTLTTTVGQAGGTGTLINVGHFPGLVPLCIFGSAIYAYYSGSLHGLPFTGTGSNVIGTGRPATFINAPPAYTSGSSSATTYAVFCANGKAWAAESNSGLLGYTNLTPPNSVPLCDGAAWLDQQLYLMDINGNIWGSNVNTVNTWTGSTVIEVGGRYDIPVCLAQQLEYIVALKSTSLRCFYDAGAAAQTLGVGSNLSWVEGADANFGCANAGTVQLIDQSLLWVTNNDKGTAQVAQMDGLQVKIISTPPVERLLQSLNMSAFSANPNDAGSVLYSAGIKRGGHRFYIITVPAVSTTNGIPFSLCYDLDQQLWYPWTSPGLTYWSVTGASSQCTTSNGIMCQDISSGALYVTDIDQVYPTDSGIQCQVDIYTPNADFGTKRRKTLNAMYFQNDQVSGSVMQVRKSDNDYRSWGPFRKVSLSTDRPNMTRCGTFTKRALNIRHNAATPFRIKASDLQLDIGTN